MTAVEFYDRAPIENIISSLTTAPNKIIFIGEGKLNKKFDLVYRPFLKERGLDTVLEYRNIKRNDLMSIVSVLSEIAQTEDECVFDLTGGEDLVLVAMGIVFQKYKDTKNIQLQRFNFKNGRINDCDNDGNLVYSGMPEITVEENISLNGGVVRYEADGDDRTYRWDFDEEFLSDINTMWNICKNNPGRWNSQVNVLEVAAENFPLNGLSICIDLKKLNHFLAQSDVKYVNILPLLNIFSKKRLIKNLVSDDAHISFSFKNEQIERCLTKAGTVLELKVLLLARSATHRDGTAYFTDSMNGVYIDWDGVLHENDDLQKDTENEIDVLLMKGLTPVFISCKNGTVNANELYKLDTVANRFGGVYAKRVLIATYYGKNTKSLPHFKQRAKDMNITLIDGVHKMTDTQIIKQLKHMMNS